MKKVRRLKYMVKTPDKLVLKKTTHPRTWKLKPWARLEPILQYCVQAEKVNMITLASYITPNIYTERIGIWVRIDFMLLDLKGSFDIQRRIQT